MAETTIAEVAVSSLFGRAAGHSSVPATDLAAAARAKGVGTWQRCLRRRSQKSRRMGWPEFETLTARFRLPTPRITRTWAQARI